jgi:ligand-binding sensor domain-containing protein
MEEGRLGAGKFTTYMDMNGVGGSSQNIISILEDASGALWFSTTGSDASLGIGVYRFDGKNWTLFKKSNGLQANEIKSMAVAPDGAIWFGGFGVSRFDGKSWTVYTTRNGLPSDDIRAVKVATNGNVWIGTADSGAACFSGKTWQYYRGKPYFEGDYVEPIFELPDGSLLFDSSNGFSASLTRFDGQHWETYPTPWTEGGHYTSAMAATANGGLWFGTEQFGVYRFSQGSWVHYTMKDGLADDTVNGLAVAKDGSVWVGTPKGLSQFDHDQWRTFKLEGDKGNNWVGPVFAASEGSVWFAYVGGIARYTP